MLSRLLDKEHTAHKALGDAASLMKLHSTSAEEDAVRAALAEGRNLDTVAPDPGTNDDSDSFDDLFIRVGEDLPEAPPVIEGYDLFRTELDFLREAVHEIYDDPARRIRWSEDHQDGTVEFVPPTDLMGRLDALPQSYLAQRRIRERLVLAVDQRTGKAELDRARRAVGSGTSWPEAHFLGPLHPVLDWAADKALSRFGRGEVPVVTGAVDEPLVVGLGTLSNGRGQVVLRALIGLSFFDESIDPYVVQEEQVLDLLHKAGVRDGGINSGRHIDTDRWQSLVPKAIDQMRHYMKGVRQQRTMTVQEPLRRAAYRIRDWRKRSEQLALELAPSHRARMTRSVERHGRQAEDLVKELAAREAPMLRVLAVVVPEEVTE